MEGAPCSAHALDAAFGLPALAEVRSCIAAALSCTIVYDRSLQPALPLTRFAVVGSALPPVVRVHSGSGGMGAPDGCVHWEGPGGGVGDPPAGSTNDAPVAESHAVENRIAQIAQKPTAAGK